MMQAKPDYSNNIVNLMSSIGEASGVASPYSPLDSLEYLKESKNIVLTIVDGLGYNYLQKYGRGTTLHKYLKGSITSVFPPSTGSAITSFWVNTAPTLAGFSEYINARSLLRGLIPVCAPQHLIPLTFVIFLIIVL